MVKKKVGQGREKELWTQLLPVTLFSHGKWEQAWWLQNASVYNLATSNVKGILQGWKVPPCGIWYWSNLEACTYSLTKLDLEEEENTWRMDLVTEEDGRLSFSFQGGRVFCPGRAWLEHVAFIRKVITPRWGWWLDWKFCRSGWKSDKVNFSFSQESYFRVIFLEPIFHDLLTEIPSFFFFSSFHLHRLDRFSQ